MANGKFPPMPPGYGKSAKAISGADKVVEKEVVINDPVESPPPIEGKPQEANQVSSKISDSFENVSSSYFDDGDDVSKATEGGAPRAESMQAAPPQHQENPIQHHQEQQTHYQEEAPIQQPHQQAPTAPPRQHYQQEPRLDPNMAHAGVAMGGAAYAGASNPAPLYDPEEVLFSSHPAMFSNKPTVFIMYVLMLPILVGFAGFIFWRMQIKAARLQVKGRTIYYKEGIFAKQTAEINVENTRTIKVVQSFAQRIFSTGDVLIYTGGDEPEVIAKGYPNLQEFNAVVGKLKANTPPGVYPHRY